MTKDEAELAKYWCERAEKARAELIASVASIKEQVVRESLRNWVGLTDEEILDIVGRAGAGYPAVVPPYTRDLFKKIEDKLREKNG